MPFKLKKNSVVKYCYQLNETVLFPNNLQKQNVNFAVKIFHQSNIAGLKFLGPQCNNLSGWEETAEFLSIIKDWWEIVNVSSCGKGIRKRNEKMNPIFFMDGPQGDFLKKFLSWVEMWQDLLTENSSAKGLSKETFKSSIHSTKSHIRLIHYALSTLKWKYVLLGKFQTDKLEARFGQYRQLSGCNYNVSLQQIRESEKKLKISSLLELHSAEKGKLSIRELCESFTPDSDISENDSNFIKDMQN